MASVLFIKFSLGLLLNDHSLRPCIQCLIDSLDVSRVICIGFLYKSGQVFKDERVLEDASVILGTSINIFIFIIGNRLQVFELTLVVHFLGSIPQLASAVSHLLLRGVFHDDRACDIGSHIHTFLAR